ncbi:MAG: rhomboid family intramembrane serine protease [Armatimonadetes bacterium]|nr:rhomboid family intramembrane serine protease [Armatimonadota bacterium]
MRTTNTAEQITYWLFKDRIPFTKLVILANIATWLAIGFGARALFYYLGFVFEPARGLAAAVPYPWTLITYPFVGAGDVLGMLFGLYWLWLAGGSLERSWGTARFAYYFFAMCVITAAGLAMGGILIRTNIVLAGILMPLAGVTVAFAMLNPEEQIRFWFVLPLKLKYLAVIDVVLILVSYGLPLGIFALAGCAFSFWYVVRPHRYSSSRRENRGQVVRVHRRQTWLRKLNPFAWIHEYRDRKRLKKLFERSDSGDSDTGNRP